MSMNKFDCIKAFITIVEQGSIINAARKLKQTNAAISKKLSKLEADLGVRLAVRNQKLLQLTDIGAQYYQQCKELLAKFDEGERILKHVKADPSGTLNVITHRYMAEKYIFPKLQGFIQRNPKIDLNINIVERMPDFDNKDVDIVFGTVFPSNNEVVKKKLSETRYVLCGSPAYFKRHGTPTKPRDLSQHVFITHSQRKPTNQIVLDDEQHINVRSILRINDTYGLGLAATQHIGMIWLREYLVEDLLTKKKLITVMSEYTRQKVPVYLYYLHHRFIEPKIIAFENYFA
jgi:DNA-binding transcriptional LysR family regulator